MYVDHVCVIGDGKKYLSALIVPQFELLEKIANEKNIKYNNHKELVESPDIIRFYTEIVEKVNQGLARYEQIKKYRLLTRPFSEETGELTPTQKMKRKIIIKNYSSEIEALYS